MQSLSYWKQFESTGKVEDYLFYSGMTPYEFGEYLLETADCPRTEAMPSGSVERAGLGTVGSESL